jgi:predicted MPP superfamily phosphohydrolase
VAAAAVIPTAWYGGIKEPNDIEIVRRTFLIKKLAPKLEGMTAIQISDLHLDAGSDGHARMIDLVKSLRPDLVFFTGDLVNDAGATATAEEIFRSIEAPGGTWAVLGNSDHSANVTDFLPARLASARVRYLVNESSELASGLWIVGVDDPSGGSDDLESAIQNLPDGAPAILLATRPISSTGCNAGPLTWCWLATPMAGRSTCLSLTVPGS